MSKFWSTICKKVTPYIPGEQPQNEKFIKLNTNENPYPPSPGVMDVLNSIPVQDLRLYPDPNCTGLKRALADNYNVKPEQIFVGNGSDEVLAFAFQAFFEPESTILFPDISYSFYPVYCTLYNINYKKVPLNSDFEIVLDDYMEENSGIIIANPNAPTGKILSQAAIKKILEANPDRVVIIDEAYIAFGGESALGLIHDYPNLLIINTFSKSHSLAGLRVGYAIGDEELITGLKRIKNSFNSYTIDRIALQCAAEAISDKKYFEETTGKIIKTREKLTKKLTDIGFLVNESYANFIFIQFPGISGKTLYEKLKQERILVRHFDKPRIENFIRVSIGVEEDMDRFYEAISEIVS